MTARRPRLLALALGGAVALAALGFAGRGGAVDVGGAGRGGAATPPDRDRPNVLFIVVDDLRPALGAYGDSTAVTPNLDRLAGQSVLFERAYASVPVCGASRASLLTGLAPTRGRFTTYDTRADEDAPGVETLPGYFRAQGFRTAAIGKVFHEADDSVDAWDTPPWHPDPGVNGLWRQYVRPENVALDARAGRRGPPYERADVPDAAYYDGQMAEEAVRRLGDLAGGADPFFLAVGFVKPHLPFNAPERYWDLHPYGEVELPQSGALPLGAPAEAWRVHSWGELRSYAGVPADGPVPDSLARRLVQGYRAATSYVDAQVGLVLDELDRLGLAENTVVVVFGDHGFSLGEHGLWSKHSTFDVALRVPLLIRAPGRAPGPASAFASLLDLYPTLTDLAGLPRPGHLDGTSLVPFLDRPARPGREAVFARYFDAEAARTDGFLYSAWLTDADSAYADMLYDHRADPRETVDLSEAPAYAPTVARHRALLDRRRADGAHSAHR